MKSIAVHALVAAAFLGERPKGCDIDHRNGIKTDNRVENLEYVTRGENIHRALCLGSRRYLHEAHFMAKLNQQAAKVIRHMRGKVPQRRLASLYKIDRSVISLIQTGKLWREEGFYELR